MPIRILPPQLANQIAAGEVVERPASVVKELVENSLDAGASQVDIEIEKGGSKLIRVRDNGSGIAENELVLALSRHATSKITNLDDLEAISSLGFRGEALASISSVSRLTLTSNTATQAAAWQASAAGRDMQVDVRPAAHPQGTSIEVLDLFFNTPARRKFLRTDKTEFGHIDELVKRLALSRYDVAWQLTHNGQSVRRLKAATTDEQRQKRVATLCGRAFAEQAAFIENQYDNVRLWGWIVQPQACSAQLQCQYSYVNGRMMRDKLLNHAIRQAYGDRLSDEQQPAFVLYLELDPRQVDVNVHPAKHEVRFHQARLIHDFVVSALADALTQLSPRSPGLPNSTTSRTEHAVLSAHEPQRAIYRPHSVGGYASERRPEQNAVRQELSYWQQRQPVPPAADPDGAEPSLSQRMASTATAPLIVQNRYLLQQQHEQIVLVDLVPTLSAYFSANKQVAVPLLLPQRISVTARQLAYLTAQAEQFNRIVLICC
jgi:DNA mismatch repair protein MutL